MPLQVTPNSDLWLEFSWGTAANREASDMVTQDLLAVGVTSGNGLMPPGFTGTAKFAGAVRVVERKRRLARSSWTRSGSGRSESDSESLWKSCAHWWKAETGGTSRQGLTKPLPFSLQPRDGEEIRLGGIFYDLQKIKIIEGGEKKLNK